MVRFAVALAKSGVTTRRRRGSLTLAATKVRPVAERARIRRSDSTSGNSGIGGAGLVRERLEGASETDEVGRGKRRGARRRIDSRGVEHGFDAIGPQAKSTT